MRRDMLIDEPMTARSDLSEIERIREALSPVLANRFFHFERPKGTEWMGIVVGLFFRPFHHVVYLASLIISLNIFSYSFLYSVF